MSDMMPGGMPQMGRTPVAQSGGMGAMDSNRSIMNPIDTAAMAQTGTIKPGMTVRDLIEKVFKVPIDAPVGQLTEAIKLQGQNRTGIGKVSAMAQGAPPQMGQPQQMPNRMPQGQPSAVPKQSISELMR